MQASLTGSSPQTVEKVSVCKIIVVSYNTAYLANVTDFCSVSVRIAFVEYNLSTFSKNKKCVVFVGVLCFEWKLTNNMVPQQNDSSRSSSPTSSGIPMFGSQLINKNSSTPYTDATQVSYPRHPKKQNVGCSVPSDRICCCKLVLFNRRWNCAFGLLIRLLLTFYSIHV